MKKRKWLLIVLGLVMFACLGAVVMQLGGSGGGSDASEQVAATTSESAEKQAPAAQEAAATTAPKATNTAKPEPTATPMPVVGDSVDTGEMLWIALEAKDLGNTLKSDNQFIDSKTTEGRFIQVRFKVENQGTDKQYFDAPDLIDSKDREFSDYNESLFFIPDAEQCVLKELGPNVPATCTVIYEVAADATGLRARVAAPLFGDEIDIDLGLK